MGQDCKFCGAYISGRAEKCPACGKRINYKEETKSSYTAGAAQAYSYAEPERETKKEEPKTERYTYSYKEDPRTHYETAPQPKAAPAADADADAKNNQLISFLCYFGLLFLIPYLTKPNSEFVKFHSNQGLVLLITSAIVQVAAEIVPLVGWLVGLVGGIFVFACFLKGLINVYHLEKKELPYIGSFKLLK